jgi:hypothetical protein
MSGNKIIVRKKQFDRDVCYTDIHKKWTSMLSLATRLLVYYCSLSKASKDIPVTGRGGL